MATSADGPAAPEDLITTSAPAGSWREVLAPYSRPHLGRSLLDLLTSVVAYLALVVAGYALVDRSPWLVLALAPLTGGFLLRTYIVFHDCAHGSFLPGRRANELLGPVLGLLVWSPFAKWKHEHAVHHATAGDLDRRGVGDVTTLTVAEYRAKPWKGRLGYWLFRHPLVMFGIGPIWALVVNPRRWSRRMRPRLRRSVLLTNLALLVVVGAQIWGFGPGAVLLVQGPAMYVAAAAGVFLFYVQHQFEDVYWESGERWSYADAALRGSSHLRLPKLLQFFSGNIGLHHVHHLSARVPNYNLQRAHDDNPVFHDVPTLTLLEGLRCTRLKLWDEDRGRLVRFGEARRSFGSPSVAEQGAPA